MFHVYKLHLSDEIVAVVNSQGWQASPEGIVYNKLSFAKADDPEMPIHVMAAALLGMYEHGLTVEAPSIDAVFDYDNGAPFETGVEPIYHCKGLRSMSVGDVIVGGGAVRVCCSRGWGELPKHGAVAFAMMGKKIACRRPNALPETDSKEEN